MQLDNMNEFEITNAKIANIDMQLDDMTESEITNAKNITSKIDIGGVLISYITYHVPQ